MTIREAYELSGMTAKEISKYLDVPLRTFQDWMYERRNPKRTDIAERIMAMSIMTKEGRDSLILEDNDWETVMKQYKIETARRLSAVGTFRETFSKSLARVPESCMVLPAEALAELVDALHQAYQDGRSENI